MIPREQLQKDKRYQGFYRKGKAQEFAMATWDGEMFRKVCSWRNNADLPDAYHYSTNKEPSFDPQTGAGDWCR